MMNEYFLTNINVCMKGKHAGLHEKHIFRTKHLGTLFRTSYRQSFVLIDSLRKNTFKENSFDTVIKSRYIYR